ncbi:MAG: hypothetical protein QG577_2619 [Thermodesulfobacteriota bacterium]|nr:hypothetical protein [Thermodesulfobacteriota bacterium]
MNWSKVLIYFIILCALGAWVFFFEIRHKGEKQAQEEKASQLVALDKENVTEIELKREDGGIIQLKKLEDRWVLVEPIKTAADQSAVSSLIISAQLAKAERILQDQDVKWAEYGLERAPVSVALSSKDSRTQLFIGENNPSKTSYYMRVGDDPRLFLVADTLKNALHKTVFDLREKSVLSLAPSDIERVVVKINGKETEIARQGADKWMMVKPEEMRLKASVLNRDLISLTNLRAKQIIDEPNLSDDQYGLTSPRASVELSGPKAGQTLIVGGPVKEAPSATGDSDVYVAVKDRSNVYIVEGKPLKAFSPPDTHALRDKSLVSFNLPDVEKLQLELDGKKWVAIRKDEKQWTLEEPQKISSLDAWSITSILWELKDLEWKSIAKGDLPESSGDRGQKLVASLYLKGQNDPTVVTVSWKASPHESEKPATDKSEGVAADASASQDSSAPSEPVRNVPASTKHTPVPELVNAVVDPHEEKGAVFQIPGSFVTRLRNDVERIVAKK